MFTRRTNPRQQATLVPRGGSSPDMPCLRTQLDGRTRRFVSMLGIFPGELIGVGFLVLTAVLLGGFVYFFFIKKG